MRLAPARDLHRLGEPADIADIEPVELMNAALDIGQELPLAGKFLADGKGDVGHPAQGLVGLRRLVAYRLLEEIEHAAAEFVAEARGLRHRQPMMIVDAEHHVLAQRLARLVQHARRGAYRLARLEDVLAVLAGGKEADRLPSLRAQLMGAFDGSIARGFVSGRGEGGDAFPLLAAEQFVDRHSQRLALDIMKGDVDGGNRRLQNPPTLEILAAIKLLPDPADLHGVAADEELAIMLDGAGHGLLAAAQSALAPAEDALVGLDLDKHLVARSHPHWVGLDRGDLKFRRHSRHVHTHPPRQSALRAISVSLSNRCIRSWSNSSQIRSSGATAMLGGTLTLTMAPDRNA